MSAQEVQQLEEEVRSARVALGSEQIAAKHEISEQRKEAAKLLSRVRLLEERLGASVSAVTGPLWRRNRVLRAQVEVASRHASVAESFQAHEAACVAAAQRELVALQNTLHRVEVRAREQIGRAHV